MSTNSLLTPCKQGAVLSRYSMALAMSTNSLLTPFKQGAVLSRYFMALAMSTNSLLTPCKQGAVLSRYSIGLDNENELLIHTWLTTRGTLLTSVYNYASS